MNRSARVLRVLILSQAGCLILALYVKAQWPSPVKEIDIPPGKVEVIPGTKWKAILCQGKRGGLSMWYRLPDKSEASQTNVVMKIKFYDPTQ